MRIPQLFPLLLLIAVPVAAAQTAPATQPAARALFDEAMRWQGGDGADSPIDLPKAETLLRQAAAAGDTEAMDRLGDMYRDGDGGLSVDFAQARAWYEKEAAAGAAWGFYSLAEFYRYGQGVEKNDAKVEELAKQTFAAAKAGAERGDYPSMDALAWCYRGGIGVDKSQPEGMKWMRRAADAGFPPSMAGMAMDEGVQNKQQEVAGWLTKAAERGITTAAEGLAYRDIYGFGGTKDPAAGIRWLERAVAMGRSRSCEAIGGLYRKGVEGVVEKDEKKAAEWFARGAAKGDPVSMCELAACYEDGVGVDQDYAAAAGWYRKSADASDPDAMFELAKLYELGTGVPASPTDAHKWYEKAAARGHAAAREWLDAQTIK